MANSFSQQVIYNKKSLLATIIPTLRNDGMHYEVNIKGYPRFLMAWSQLDRYDAVGEEGKGIPYELVLAVSDAIEQREGKR